MSDARPFAQRAICKECPWRTDVPAGKFSPERFIALAPTCDPEAGFDIYTQDLPAIFACHMSREGGERACVGMLATCGTDNIRVRLAISHRRWSPRDLPAELPPLHRDYPAMAIANGVPPDHPALDPWKPRRGRRTRHG